MNQDLAVLIAEAVAAVIVILSAVNGVTLHWSESRGNIVTRLLLLVCELASMVSSKGVRPKMKPPLTSRPPELYNGMTPRETPKSKARTLFIVLMVSLMGCASSPRKTLTAIHVGAKEAWTQMRPVFHQHCKAVAEECLTNKESDCAALQACQAKRRAMVTALGGIHSSVAAALSIVDELDKGEENDSHSD